jgi:hypothetical protein
MNNLADIHVEGRARDSAIFNLAVIINCADAMTTTIFTKAFLRMFRSSAGFCWKQVRSHFRLTRLPIDTEGNFGKCNNAPVKHMHPAVG